MPGFDELRRNLVEHVQNEHVRRICDNEKFIGRKKLIARFENQVVHWRTNEQFGRILETINEIATADAILSSTGDIRELAYEVPLVGTDKTLDFRLTFACGNRCWIDVKTIAPRWDDSDSSWWRFKRLAAGFPANAQLVVDRHLAGAAISGQEIKARWTFIRRTLEIEAKEALLTPDEKAPVRLLFCSNGAMRKDGLEDFADFYRTGSFRSDDWSRNAVSRYLTDENIVFGRTLAGFGYLYFCQLAAMVEEFEIDVRAP